MIETLVFEDNGGQIHAVVIQERIITNIVDGFEHGGFTTAEFVWEAQHGFAYADEFDPNENGGSSMEQVFYDMMYYSTDYDLIAEISEDDILLYPKSMGTAGKILFGLDK